VSRAVTYSEQVMIGLTRHWEDGRGQRWIVTGGWEAKIIRTVRAGSISYT